MKQHPLFFDPGLPAPLQATVSKGDLLYLPSIVVSPCAGKLRMTREESSPSTGGMTCAGTFEPPIHGWWNRMYQ
eukprot:jgi/Botrbrau1/23523/Bobra.106_1s0070.1